MTRRAACLLVLLCVATSLSGCLGLGTSKDEATFDCKRGFRVADWQSTRRLRTGQSIAKCDWLAGWSERRVRRDLGRPDFGPRLAPEYVLPGGADASRNLQQWVLKLRFDPSDRRLVSAKTAKMNT
jgi:hypothetical protein